MQLASNSTNTPQDRLLTAREVAAMLALRQRAFWDVVHQQGLPFIRLNARVIRFRRADVDTWLEGRTMR